MLSLTSVQTIEKSLEEAQQNYQKRILGLVDENMMPPTWDGSRYHAPCDNYVFDGINYAAGQFLHTPEDLSSDAQLARRGFGSSGKMKFAVATSAMASFQSVVEKFGGTVGFGKSWMNHDLEICYAYVEGSWSLLNRIRKLVPESGREMVEAGTAETGSTWTTTAGKLFKSKMFIGPTGVESTENINEDLLRKILTWYLDETPKKKTVRLEVGYCYKTYIIS